MDSEPDKVLLNEFLKIDRDTFNFFLWLGRLIEVPDFQKVVSSRNQELLFLIEVVALDLLLLLN